MPNLVTISSSAMPSQYPPYSSARHAAIDARRSSRGASREGRSRDGQPRVQQDNQYHQQDAQYQQQEPQYYQQTTTTVQHRQQDNQYRQQDNQHRRQDNQYRPQDPQYRSSEKQYNRQSTHEQHGQKESKMKTLKGHLIAMLGEFIGTTMFLWVALAGTQSAATLTANMPTDQISKVFYIALVFGLSLLVCAWAFYRISGGLFNPAVTIGLCVAGQMPWIRGLFVFPAQILGGIAAAGLVSCMFPGDISNTITTLTDGTSIARGVFIEAFMTFLLVFVILMLAVEKNHARSVAPVAIGLALFVAMLAGVPYTGGSLNPARSFGPSVVTPSFPHYHYIYWFGPILGAIVAALYHRALKGLDYEEAQPGQDAPHGEAQYRVEKQSRNSGQY